MDKYFWSDVGYMLFLLALALLIGKGCSDDAKFAEQCRAQGGEVFTVMTSLYSSEQHCLPRGTFIHIEEGP